MKPSLFVVAALLSASQVGAASIESLNMGADRSFFLSPLSALAAVQTAGRLSQAAQQPLNVVTLKPAVRALGASEALGSEIGRVKLADQFDRNLFLLKETLGSRKLDMGMVTDAGAKTHFLSFMDATGTTLGAIGNWGDLQGKGVDIRIDAATVYNFRVEIGSIFDDPVHKSIVYVTPVAGTVGPSSQMTTGALLDAIRAKSAVITIDGEDYLLFYGRDALADGSGFAKTRGVLVTHQAGTSMNEWPVSESALPLDTPVAVSLGDAQVQMTRTSAGELIINAAN